MKRVRALFVALCFALPVLSPSTAPALPAKAVVYKVGVMHRQFTPPEPYEWRGAKTHELITDIWYPADPAANEQMQWIGSVDAPFAKGAKAAPGAALVPGSDKFPLILRSGGELLRKNSQLPSQIV